MVKRAKHPTRTAKIALVGKYVALHDAYLSVVEALAHGGIENDAKVEIRWVNSEEVTDEKLMQEAQGACPENDNLDNMHFEVTLETVCATLKAADACGRYYLSLYQD